jgi:pentatricopeptide repeat protein
MHAGNDLPATPLALPCCAGEEGGSARRWPAVLRVLHGMQMRIPHYKDTHVQTVAVSLAARHGRLGDALEVYRLMLQDGVQPKSPTFNACEQGWRAGGQLCAAVSVTAGSAESVGTVATHPPIHPPQRKPQPANAEPLWPFCNIAVIAACMRAGMPARGFRFFDIMQAMGVQASSSAAGDRRAAEP